MEGGGRCRSVVLGEGGGGLLGSWVIAWFDGWMDEWSAGWIVGWLDG